MSPETRVAAIESILTAKFAPTELTVIDESHKHIGHEGARDGRGHFAVHIVAEAFRGKSAVAQHQAIYAQLADLMLSDIHALSIKAQAP